MCITKKYRLGNNITCIGRIYHIICTVCYEFKIGIRRFRYVYATLEYVYKKYYKCVYMRDKDVKHRENRV